MYIRLSDLAVLSINEVRRLHPDKTIPDGANLDEFGYRDITYTAPTGIKRFHYLSPVFPVERDGVWTLEHDIIPHSYNDIEQMITTEISTKRRAVEFGGMTLFDGYRISTEVSDQNRIISVVVMMELAGMEVIDFESESGYITLTYAQVQDMAKAVAQHVQRCFTINRQHIEAVHAILAQEDSPAKLEALVAYDVNQYWEVPTL